MGQENKTSTQSEKSNDETDAVIVTDALLADDERKAELIDGGALPVYGLGRLGIRSLNELPSDPYVKTHLGIK